MKRENLLLKVESNMGSPLIGSSYNFKNQTSRGLPFKIRLLLEGASDASRMRTFPRQ